MEKIRKRVYFENPNDDNLDELYDKFAEVDFQYGNAYIVFHGYPERLQEILRYARTLGLKEKE